MSEKNKWVNVLSYILPLLMVLIRDRTDRTEMDVLETKLN